MKNFNWYRNRLALMSLAEVGHRAASSVKRTWERFTPLPEKYPLLENKTTARWFWDLDQKQALRGLFEQQAWDPVPYAKNVLEHRLTIFALTEKQLDPTIDWHRDYKNGRSAPLRYTPTINYRDFDQVGDIKYIWELNRHQHLVDLAKAYYLTGKERFKQEVIKQVFSWIQQNPCRRGVNWESALELGIRLISWSWAWALCGPFDDDVKRTWLASVYLHGSAIASNFSRYSSANNHLIGEAAGLYVSALVFPFWKESQEWQRLARAILIREMETQNYPDGVNKEQAIPYQQFVLDFFLLAGLLGKNNNDDFPPAYWQRMERMMEFLAALMDRQGHVPFIGDGDDGAAVILSRQADFNPYRSLLATGSVLFERGDFKIKAGDWDEKSSWLLGPEARRTYENLAAAPVARIPRFFADGGYVVLAENEGTPEEIKCVFDSGPLGYLSLAAHGHADALSVTLSVGGHEILTDPGTYAYHTDPLWRDYFRGTAAHNTVRVDGLDQSESGGNFMWLRKANVFLEKCALGGVGETDQVRGRHDGYHRLPDPVTHTREILFDKKQKSFLLSDRIDAVRRHRLEILFHCSQECSVEAVSLHRWRLRHNSAEVDIVFDPRLVVQAQRGSVDPILGWHSSHFDKKVPSTTLVASLEATGCVVLETKIEIRARG